MAELSFRKRGEKWEYRFEAAKINGRRKQISKCGFRTKKEAQQAGTKALAEYNQSGLHLTSCDLSVSDFLDFWLENYCQINLKYNTIVGYRNVIENHIKPRIGQYRLTTVTTPVLQKLINDIYVERTFTKSSLKNILNIIKGSFKYAVVTAKFLPASPAEDVSLPRYDTTKKHQIQVLSKTDVATILNRFQGAPYQYYAILTGYYTGLRIGEVYGLTWECIDFEEQTLTVDKIAVTMNLETQPRSKGARSTALTRWYLGSPKTPTSYRTIEIGDTLTQALRVYKDWQAQNQQKRKGFYIRYYIQEETGPNGQPLKRIVRANASVPVALPQADLIMVRDNGGFQGTDSMKYPSRVIHYELGIDFNFHSLRHTHATMLIENGAPIKAVSERLGHATTTVTLNTYVHNTSEMKSIAVSIFEETATLPTIQ